MVQRRNLQKQERGEPISSPTRLFSSMTTPKQTLISIIKHAHKINNDPNPGLLPRPQTGRAWHQSQEKGVRSGAWGGSRNKNSSNQERNCCFLHSHLEQAHHHPTPAKSGSTVYSTTQAPPQGLPPTPYPYSSTQSHPPSPVRTPFQS